MKRPFDFGIYIPILLLSLFSLFNLFGINSSLVGNQLIYLIFGQFVFFVAFFLGISFFRFNSKFFYGAIIILLIITFIIGVESRGSKRWIDLYFFRFQSSEFLKVFFIIALSDFLLAAKWSGKMIIQIVIFFIIPILIVLRQPDLGNAVIFLIVFLNLLFFSGLSVKYFMLGGAFFLAFVPIMFKFLKSYQKNRLLSFIHRDVDPTGVSYNLIQSIITIGSGEFLGKGLGLGTQSRFLFLPENHTDFAFASLVEQFGFIGGMIVIILYVVILYHLVKKALMVQNDKFQFLFLIGVITFLCAQVTINIGVNMGLFPIAGIALPLITYGGSSVLTTMLLLGLAAGI